ncbi:MAG: hypothetical protein ACRDQU_12120 [Pseudonocardiaceae bacterium]
MDPAMVNRITVTDEETESTYSDVPRSHELTIQQDRSGGIVIDTSSISETAAAEGKAADEVTDSVPATDVAPDDEAAARIIGGSAASTKNYPWRVIQAAV